MNGGVLYVYAVTAGPSGPEATGLHGAPLRAIECGEVQAVVSEHSVAPEPDEDLLWVHERVVEGLMEEATILPMRFGSTVETPEALVEMLERRQEEFVASLERVRGAVELSVRAQLPSVAEPAGAEPRVAAEHPGPGTAYLLERAQQEQRGEEAVDLIHRPLAALARRSAANARGRDSRVFKAAYLVDEEAVESFGRRVRRLNATLGDIKVSCTGPWPPYSFVSEEPG